MLKQNRFLSWPYLHYRHTPRSFYSKPRQVTNRLHGGAGLTYTKKGGPQAAKNVIDEKEQIIT